MSPLPVSDLAAECLRTPILRAVPSRPALMARSVLACRAPSTRRCGTTVQPKMVTPRGNLVHAPVGSSNNSGDVLPSSRRRVYVERESPYPAG